MPIKPFRFIIAGMIFYLLMTGSSFSQQPIKTYDKEWKQVNEFKARRDAMMKQ